MLGLVVVIGSVICAFAVFIAPFLIALALIDWAQRTAK